MTMGDANPEIHAQWMRLAIQLSKRGYPMPNPHVGCVIVRDGQVVGQGWHEEAGTHHAEVVALHEAGDAARGADVYVTLEPCNHHGRTPPCSLALIEAGVARVFVAVQDPNPVAAGGMEALRKAGIECLSGLLEDEAVEVNNVWITAIRRGTPYVHLKAAMTLDGFIAHEDGRSQWITNAQSREMGHEFRARMGAVLIGKRTAEFDNPELTVRLPHLERIVSRFVLDPKRTLPETLRIFQGDLPAVRICREEFAQPRDIAIHAAEGEPMAIPEIVSGIGKLGVRGILVEGGAHTFQEFLTADAADEISLFVAPKIFGKGIQLFPKDQAFDLFEGETSSRVLGSDVLINFKKK